MFTRDRGGGGGGVAPSTIGLFFALVIIGISIEMVDRRSSNAGWILAGLIILGALIQYPAALTEISRLIGQAGQLVRR